MRPAILWRHTRLMVAIGGGILAFAAGAILLGQGPANATSGGVQIHTWHAGKNVYLLVPDDGSANAAVQIGAEGVLMVDTMTDELVPKMMAEIRKLTSLPVRYIVNTTLDPDHTLGNVAMVASGVRSAQPRPLGAPGLATIIAHENVNIRMVNPDPGFPAVRADGWPNDAYFNARRDFGFNGEAVQVIHEPKAHTDGDSIVHFRGSDVIVAGDVFLTTTYPVIDFKHGGTLQGIIDAANHIIDIAVPEDHEEGGTMIIPGHGRMCDEADVDEYRNMLTIIRDRIADLKKKGQTLAQVKAARPTRDYDRRYGANTGRWTTDMFVEAAYNTIQIESDSQANPGAKK
jgi:glyoxylase-like metal-dependent hydrolase (beta-lactamase superfamily II)